MSFRDLSMALPFFSYRKVITFHWESRNNNSAGKGLKTLDKSRMAPSYIWDVPEHSAAENGNSLTEFPGRHLGWLRAYQLRADGYSFPVSHPGIGISEQGPSVATLLCWSPQSHPQMIPRPKTTQSCSKLHGQHWEMKGG